MNARKWLDKHNNKRIKEGKEPYTLRYVEFTNKVDGLQYCYIEMNANGLYQGHTSCIETKYKSVFNGFKY